MSVEDGKTKQLMVSMSGGVFNQLEELSNTLGASKSRIIQMAIILMADTWQEAKNVVDKDVSRKMSKG